jgi:hypothetical protein
MLKLNKFKSVETSLQKIVIFLTVMNIKLKAGKSIKEKTLCCTEQHLNWVIPFQIKRFWKMFKISCATFFTSNKWEGGSNLAGPRGSRDQALKAASVNCG